MMRASFAATGLVARALRPAVARSLVSRAAVAASARPAAALALARPAVPAAAPSTRLMSSQTFPGSVPYLAHCECAGSAWCLRVTLAQLARGCVRSRWHRSRAEPSVLHGSVKRCHMSSFTPALTTCCMRSSSPSASQCTAVCSVRRPRQDRVRSDEGAADGVLPHHVHDPPHGDLGGQRVQGALPVAWCLLRVARQATPEGVVHEHAVLPVVAVRLLHAVPL